MGIVFDPSRQTPAVGVASYKPDYTLPLRMQAQGRSLLDAHQRHVRHLLWLRALKDSSLWRRALAATVLAEAAHVIFAP
ncbi:MAG: hypothetical protein ACM359_21610, partial [Bacillota bacterium]